MFRSARLLACASLLVLTACASAATADDPQAAEALPPAGGASAYGLFLAGHAALNAGRNAEASTYFSSAAKLSGSQEAKEQAFFAAVLAGDIARAAALAPPAGTGSDGAQRLGRLVGAVDDMAQGRGKQSLASLSGEPVGFPHRAAAALLKPWAAAAAGDWNVATAPPEAGGDRITFTLASVNRAELLERGRRFADAEAALKDLTAQPDAGGIYIEAYSNFLERRGRRPEAIALYDAAIATSPDDGALRAARNRLTVAGRAAPPLGDVRAGAARAMTGAAAAALLAKQPELCVVYLRLALRLDPKSDDAWMMLGDTLVLGGDQMAARAAYGRIAQGDDAFVEASIRTIWSYQSTDDDVAALKLARDTARKAPANVLAQTTLADVLRASKAYTESTQILDTLIARQGDQADWRLYYLRALALDKEGRWSDAERDLKKGLVLKPDEAELLNYLGYSWIDRGERLDEALGMIQKAVISEPNSGAVVDSLGWAYFRLGQYPKAVEQLERACQLEPADAEINNHLGDAYWRAGRRIEAEFQWRKVLATMSPEPALKAQLEAKLKTGLQAPVGPARVAAR